MGNSDGKVYFDIFCRSEELDYLLNSFPVALMPCMNYFAAKYITRLGKFLRRGAL